MDEGIEAAEQGCCFHCCIDLPGRCYIADIHRGLAAGRLHLRESGLQARLVAINHEYREALDSELPSCREADSPGRACSTLVNSRELVDTDIVRSVTACANSEKCGCAWFPSRRDYSPDPIALDILAADRRWLCYSIVTPE